MRRITYGFTVLTIVLWLFGLWFMPPAYNGRGWAHELFFVTGVLAWGWMALCLIIAVRPAWLERVTKTPLDSLYVWHRRLGWWALALSIRALLHEDHLFARAGALQPAQAQQGRVCG